MFTSRLVRLVVLVLTGALASVMAALSLGAAAANAEAGACKYDCITGYHFDVGAENAWLHVTTRVPTTASFAIGEHGYAAEQTVKSKYGYVHDITVSNLQQNHLYDGMLTLKEAGGSTVKVPESLIHTYLRNVSVYVSRVKFDSDGDYVGEGEVQGFIRPRGYSASTIFGERNVDAGDSVYPGGPFSFHGVPASFTLDSTMLDLDWSSDVISSNWNTCGFMAGHTPNFWRPTGNGSDECRDWATASVPVNAQFSPKNGSDYATYKGTADASGLKFQIYFSVRTTFTLPMPV